MEKSMEQEAGEDQEHRGQPTSSPGVDCNTTKQSDWLKTEKDGGPLHPTLAKRTEPNDDDDVFLKIRPPQ